MTPDEFESMPRLTLGMLETLSGIERRRLRRQLAADSIPVRRYGTKYAVDRAAIRRLAPDFYEGILERIGQATRAR